jgi:hypothetical protein
MWWMIVAVGLVAGATGVVVRTRRGGVTVDSVSAQWLSDNRVERL